MYLDFLKAYRAWLDDGAPQNEPFNRRTGLCHNLKRYVVAHTRDGGFDWTPITELHNRLKCVFGDANFPFNEGNQAVYDEEANYIGCHLNPDRIAFVDAEIERLENGL